jgi:hypothetical protein
MTMPLVKSSCSAALIMRAAVSGSSARAGALHPDRRVKNAGNSSVPYAHTHTPCPLASTVVDAAKAKLSCHALDIIPTSSM